jgi:hypothetical protein
MKGFLIIAVLAFAGCAGQEGDSPNRHPFIVSASPGEGEILTLGAGVPLAIAVTVGDEDLTDALFFRFLVDYPGGDNPSHLVFQSQVPPSASVVRSPMRLQPSCRFGVGPGLHRLVLSVSDRPFLDPAAGHNVDRAAPLDTVPEEAGRLRVVWLLNCP